MNQLDKETRQLLAWYVNGTLAGTDRDRVESGLENDAGASGLLAWERAVQAAIKSDTTLDVSADHGLSQTMQRIRAGAKSKTQPQATRGGWRVGLGERFRLTAPLAIACGVVVLQFAVIAQLWLARGEESEYAGVRAVGRQLPAANAFIRIAFKPESTEGDLNSLLRAIHAEIVAGPSQLGDYYLLLEAQGAQSAQDALAALQTSANVESAEIVNALPARP